MKRDTIINALSTAVDALGDIPNEQSTQQQQSAYWLCQNVLAKVMNGDSELED